MGREVQRALLWVILFGSLFMLWDNYQVYKGGKSFLLLLKRLLKPRRVRLQRIFLLRLRMQGLLKFRPRRLRSRNRWSLLRIE